MMVALHVFSHYRWGTINCRNTTSGDLAAVSMLPGHAVIEALRTSLGKPSAMSSTDAASVCVGAGSTIESVGIICDFRKTIEMLTYIGHVFGRNE